MCSVGQQLVKVEHEIIEVGLAVSCANSIVEAVVSVFVSVCPLRANQEIIHFQVVICLRERLLVDNILQTLCVLPDNGSLPLPVLPLSLALYKSLIFIHYSVALDGTVAS